MAGTPPSAKRIKSRSVKSSGKLEGWFAGDSNLINKYLLETSRKNVNTPKVVSFTWMKLLEYMALNERGVNYLRGVFENFLS